MADGGNGTGTARRLGPDTLVVVQWSTLVAVVGGIIGSVVWGTNLENRQANTEAWQARQEGSLDKVADSVERLRLEMIDGYVKYETLVIYLELLRARNSGKVDVPALPERR